MGSGISQSVIPSSRALCHSLVVWFPFSKKRTDLNANRSSRVEEDAGDDEHCRHRQHVRKGFRGRPPCGFLHTNLPRLGRESSFARSASMTFRIYSKHPATNLRLERVPTQRISTMRESNSIAAAI